MNFELKPDCCFKIKSYFIALKLGLLWAARCLQYEVTAKHSWDACLHPQKQHCQVRESDGLMTAWMTWPLTVMLDYKLWKNIFYAQLKWKRWQHLWKMVTHPKMWRLMWSNELNISSMRLAEIITEIAASCSSLDCSFLPPPPPQGLTTPSTDSSFSSTLCV